MYIMYCTCVKNSQDVWKNARWGRSVCAIGQPNTVEHHLGREMALSQTPSNPAAFLDLSCTCMMI